MILAEFHPNIFFVKMTTQVVIKHYIVQRCASGEKIASNAII